MHSMRIQTSILEIQYLPDLAMHTHQTTCHHPAVFYQRSCTYKQPPDVPGILDAFLPEGPVDPPDPGTVEKTEHGWSIGINPDITLETREKIKAFLLQNKGTFAYKLSDLVGYLGKVGPFTIAPLSREWV